MASLKNFFEKRADFPRFKKKGRSSDSFTMSDGSFVAPLKRITARKRNSCASIAAMRTTPTSSVRSTF
jgi:hypothetical protein